jgi:hypothetical protein
MDYRNNDDKSSKIDKMIESLKLQKHILEEQMSNLLSKYGKFDEIKKDKEKILEIMQSDDGDTRLAAIQVYSLYIANKKDMVLLCDKLLETDKHEKIIHFCIHFISSHLNEKDRKYFCRIFANIVLNSDYNEITRKKAYYGILRIMHLDMPDFEIFNIYNDVDIVVISSIMND